MEEKLKPPKISRRDEHLDLITTMAHELKTPLILITGLASMLEGGQFGKLNGPQRRYIQRIGAVSDRLLSLTESLLAMSKSRHRFLEPQLEPVAVASIVRAVLEELESRMSQHRITVKVLSRRAMAPVMADRESLYQIIYNLVDNAIKYSPPKSTVTIKYRHGEGWLQLLLSDHGVGIKPSEIDHLFEHFGTVGRPLAGQPSSTGLGLYIVKQLVQAQGGHIRVQALKKGSCFIVRLPLLEQLHLFASVDSGRARSAKIVATELV